MASGFKTGGRDFKPGQSGNPAGRAKLPEDIKEARGLNKIQFERMLNRYLAMSAPEIKTIAESPKTPALDLIVAKVIYEAIKKGDDKRLDFMLNRLIGPVKQILQIEQVPDAEFIADARRRGFYLVSGGKADSAREQVNPDIADRVAQLKSVK